MNPQQLLAHVNRLRTTLSAGQIASLIAAFVAVVGVVVGSAYWASTPSYTRLYRGLDPESANAVVARLKASNTAYKLEDGGSTLLVPAVKVCDSAMFERFRRSCHASALNAICTAPSGISPMNE